jgi:hypothetical protein
MVQVRAIQAEFARFLATKVPEFAREMPAGLLTSEAAEAILGEQWDRLVDEEGWTQNDLMDLASIAFLMGVGLASKEGFGK